MTDTTELVPQLRLRGQVWSARRPAIIVPVTGASIDEVMTEARAAVNAGADWVEWRADLFGEHHPAAIAQAAGVLREVLGEVPLLSTVRTQAEGGHSSATGDAYVALIAALCEASDLVDVEALQPAASEAMQAAAAAGVPVVASNHDFDHTPSVEVLVERLTLMEESGAAVAKIAVMPRSEADVAALLHATALRFSKAQIPLLTMSMGPWGTISRVVGHVFGSVATFATVGAVSAPGQATMIDVRAVWAALEQVVT